MASPVCSIVSIHHANIVVTLSNSTLNSVPVFLLHLYFRLYTWESIVCLYMHCKYNRYKCLYCTNASERHVWYNSSSNSSFVCLPLTETFGVLIFRDIMPFFVLKNLYRKRRTCMYSRLYIYSSCMVYAQLQIEVFQL